MLATNEWLLVKGCENVYAVGDCASIAQRKIMVCEATTVLTQIMHLAMVLVN